MRDAHGRACGPDRAAGPRSPIIARCCSRSTSATRRPTSAPSRAMSSRHDWRLTTEPQRDRRRARRDPGDAAAAGRPRVRIARRRDRLHGRPPARPRVRAPLPGLIGQDCLMVGPSLKTGMPILVDNPHELGADRLVNAVAAHDQVKGACVTVDFGTSTNFDVVSGAGRVPGRRDRPRRRDLAAGADRAGGEAAADRRLQPESAIGKNTRGGDPVGVRVRVRRAGGRDQPPAGRGAGGGRDDDRDRAAWRRRSLRSARRSTRSTRC